MSRTRVGLWAALSGGLVLGAMALVAAQAPRTKGPGGESASRLRRPSLPAPAYPGTTIQPLGSSFGGSSGPAPATTIPNSPTLADLPPGSFAPQVATIPIRLELRSGLTLAGQVESAALPGLTRFGEVAIPLTAMRGLRLFDGSPDAKLPEGPTATVILDNDDSLTVVLRAQQIQVKTEWGTAIVDLPQVRSLLVTSEPVQWIDSGGRWRLEPLPPSAADAPEVEAAAPNPLALPPAEVPSEPDQEDSALRGRSE